MTIHVLIVEDDDDLIEEIRNIIDALPGESEPKIARSRDEAFAQLEVGFLDLVILDLKIPTVSAPRRRRWRGWSRESGFRR